MTWDPRLQLMSVSPFRTAVIVFMEIHMADALEWAANQCELSQTPPLPEGYFESLAVRDKRPVVNVLTGGGDPEPDDDGNEQERKILTIEVERTASDGDDLVKTLEPYMLAIRSMLSEMTDNDWWGTALNVSRGDLDIRVTQERYSGRTYENEKTFLQVGSVEVVISYIQT